jgi:phenylalanine-4-hydroxylase
VNHIHLHFGEYFIDLGYIVSSSGILKYAYSICSPNDIPNNKIVQIKRIAYFFDILQIPQFGEKRITKLSDGCMFTIKVLIVQSSGD